jgi:hypothetical protein
MEEPQRLKLVRLDAMLHSAPATHVAPLRLFTQPHPPILRHHEMANLLFTHHLYHYDGSNLNFMRASQIQNRQRQSDRRTQLQSLLLKPCRPMRL